MTDLLSASVLRNLADKVYDKRKMAALEVVFPTVIRLQSGSVPRIMLYKYYASMLSFPKASDTFQVLCRVQLYIL